LVLVLVLVGVLDFGPGFTRLLALLFGARELQCQVRVRSGALEEQGGSFFIPILCDALRMRQLIACQLQVELSLGLIRRADCFGSGYLGLHLG
jgi:hypothetical protein